MKWVEAAAEGQYFLEVPDDVQTWDALRPYLAALWHKLLSDLTARNLPAQADPGLALIIDGRQGAGNIWLSVNGPLEGEAPASDTPLATGVHLEAAGVEELVAEADDWEEANCRLATEVLNALREPGVQETARTLLARHPNVTVSHDGIDPENGWYVPFTCEIAELLQGNLPPIRFTFDF